MATKLEVKRSSRITYGKNGYRVDRVAVVSGVTGNPDALLFNAINDSQLPRYGDPHPTVPGITLKNIVTDPLGGGRYRVVMSYFSDLATGTSATGITARARASTATGETSTDIKGDRMTTSYLLGSTLVTKIFSAEVERPRVTFDFTYNVSQFPQDTIDKYLGKVNSTRWNGFPARTILCTGIDADQQASGYQVRVSLSHNAEDWDFVGTLPSLFVTPSPTNPDPLLDLDNGVRPYEVYDAVDFSPLKLVL